MSIQLFSHNKQAYENVCSMLKTQNKAAVIHPTGTGKSYIAFALAEAQPEKRFLWLAPSEYIFRMQAHSLKENQRIELQNITCRTYVWLQRNMDSLENLQPDFIILDEFHRAGAPEWEKAVRRLMALNPRARILGLSATNVRYLDNRRDMAAELFSGAVASEMGLVEAMARKILPEPKYVITAYNYEKQLSEVERRNEILRVDFQKDRNAELIDILRARLQNAVGIPEIMERHIADKSGKVLLFCPDADRMHEFITKVPEWFGRVDPRPHVYSVCTYNPDAEKDFRAFLEDDSLHLKLLFSIDMLNEGVHVPGVSTVILLRPTESPIVYKQQIGRALSAGSKIQPLIIDMVNNFESLQNIDALQSELEQAHLLYSQMGGQGFADDLPFRVIDELADCRELFEMLQANLESAWDYFYAELVDYIRKTGKTQVPSRYTTENGMRLGKWLTRQKSLYNENKLETVKVKKLEEIGIEWTSESDRNFERWFALLMQYKEEFGDVHVPSKYRTEDGMALGTWCVNVRRMKERGRLPEERILRLEAIGFEWSSLAGQWEDGFNHASAYYAENGNLKVPKRFICDDGFKLGLWINTQRRVYAGAVPGLLNEEKAARLSKIGMRWDYQGKDKTTQFLAAYREYVTENHTTAVPSKYVTASGLTLGNWVERMRRQHREGTLTEKKRRELERIGFVFDTEDRWQYYYRQAKDYYNEHGTLAMSADYRKKNGASLSDWIRIQYRRYAAEGHGYLSEEQVKLLEDINITCYTRSRTLWANGIQHAEEYKEKYGILKVPQSYICEDGFKLGNWCKMVKSQYSEGRLSAERIEQLNALEIVWKNKQVPK